MSTPFNAERFEKMPLVGIMRHFPEEQLDPVVEAYAGAGLTTLEITLNSENAADTIRKLRDTWDGKLNIGAGTVCTMKELDEALDAGAQFIVTPVLRKSVIKACVKKGIPVFPGALTPSEIYQAWRWGATMVKVFPAGKMGPGYIKDVLEPLNGLKLLPTGGMGPENFIEFLRMGASGIGMASALFPKELIATGNWESLRGFYENMVQQYLRFKNENK